MYELSLARLLTVPSGHCLFAVCVRNGDNQFSFFGGGIFVRHDGELLPGLCG
ncbi:MAG: hypothetical protein ACI8P0_003493 [Planctomycetaceae bacterium]|jgi:hypothetical protein